ncbi:MAG: Rrf2 family transcriptional regulator [Candidatus Omnitrophota bacterium]
MISKTSLQIIKALLELAKLPMGETEGVVRIAQRIKAPQNYLGKVLQSMVGEGLVVSQKGLNGGFRLARTPAEIRLYDVVGFLEDLKRWEGCFMGKSVCSDKTACSAHKHWESVRNEYINFLKNTTIADLKER